MQCDRRLGFLGTAGLRKRRQQGHGGGNRMVHGLTTCVLAVHTGERGRCESCRARRSGRCPTVRNDACYTVTYAFAMQGRAGRDGCSRGGDRAVTRDSARQLQARSPASRNASGARVRRSEPGKPNASRWAPPFPCSCRTSADLRSRRAESRQRGSGAGVPGGSRALIALRRRTRRSGVVARRDRVRIRACGATVVRSY
jgi:hypothetical protein